MSPEEEQHESVRPVGTSIAHAYATWHDELFLSQPCRGVIHHARLVMNHAPTSRVIVVRGRNRITPLQVFIFIRCYQIGVPQCALFEDAALCRVVDVDDAEAFAIALGPLEVVE